MPQIAETTLRFVRELFTEHLLNVYDDPSDMIHPDEERTPPQAIAELRGVCADLGLDRDAIASTATAAERERLVSWETGHYPRKSR